MKKIILLFSLFLAAFTIIIPTKVHAQKSDIYYYEKISNSSKTINFLIGVYVTKNEYISSGDDEGYTKIRMAVINDKNADRFKWNDYKIYIQLKNGDMFYSYTTKATEGETSCTYSVSPDETHIQYVCFDKKFDVRDISKMWLSMADNKFFELSASDGK
jgi:hypothetical protein